MTAIVIALAFRQFICRACGLVYDEAKGDADSGLAPGTRFDDIPDDWACPLCGVTKADFEPCEDTPLPQRAAATATHGARQDPGVVIVGAGRAGWQMAQALREADAELPITLVSACAGDVYDKPLLSVAHAKGLVPEAMVKESALDAARRLQVRLLARTHAVSVSRSGSSLRTTRGSLRFRHLVLAHGATPRALPQLPEALCWRINHLDAYQRLRTALATGPQRVLIAGAGLVGCELANDLALAGHRITLLDTRERPLAALLDEARSAALLAAWQGLPIAFVGGVQVTAVAAEGGVKRVLTACGQAHEADHVVAATGLETPSRLARSAGLEWRNGIALDATSLRTSADNIHALGDCVSIDGQALRYIEPIARQARVIARTIVGGEPLVYRAAAVPVRVKTHSLGFTV